MKKLLVLMVAFSLLFLTGCPPKEEKEEKAEEPKVEEKAEVSIVDRLPENSEVLVKLASIESIYKHFSVTDTTAFGNPIDGLEAAKSALGFNPASLEELQANGFDTGKEFGLLLADITAKEEGGQPQFTLLIFLPVTDAAKALEVIKTSMTKEGGPGFTATQEGDVTAFTQEGTQDMLYMAPKEGYLFVTASEGLDAKAFLDSALAEGSSLTKGEAYKNVVAKLPANEEIFIYADVAAIAAENLEVFKAISQQAAGSAPVAPDFSGGIDSLKDYQGAGVSIDLDNPSLVLKGLVNLIPDAPSKKVLQGFQTDKDASLGIAEHPVLLASGALNAAEYYQMILGGLPEEDVTQFKAQLEGIKEMSGIDIEADLINNLGGNINLGLYDGSSITMGNFNTLISLTVKDAAVMQGVIDKLLAMLPQPDMVSKETVGDVEAYSAMVPAPFPVQLVFGLKDNTLIAATGKPLFEKGVNGKVDSGFVSSISDEGLADKFKKDINLFYLNVDEAMKVVKNFEMFLAGDPASAANLQKAQEVAAKFEYLASSNMLEGDSIVGELVVKTRFSEPFFIELASIIQSFTQEPEAAEEPAQE